MTKKRRPPGRPPSAITKAKRYKALSNDADPHSHQHQQHQNKTMSPHTPSVVDPDEMPILMNVNRKTPLSTQPGPTSNNSNNNINNNPAALKQPSSSASKHPNVPPGDPLPVAVAGVLPAEPRASAPAVTAKPSATTPSSSPASSTTPSPASGPGSSPTPSPASSSPTPSPTVPAPQQTTMNPTPILPAPTMPMGVPPVTTSTLPPAPPPRPASNTKMPGKSKGTKTPKTKSYKARVPKQPKNASQLQTQSQSTEPQQQVKGRETQPTRVARPTEQQQPGQTMPHGDNATTNNGSSKEEGSISDGNNSSGSKVIIFQCATCRSVVADSTLDYEFDADCTTVSLEAASNVRVDDSIGMCKQGVDAGCTFRRIICLHCSAALGRVYVTTFPELDHRRNRHTFDTDSLITYRIGEGKTPKGEDVNLLKHSQKAADANHLHKQELQKQQQQQQESMRMGANNNDTASVLAIRDLEDHVDAVTNAVNSITDAVRQIRFDIKDLRKSHDDVVAKVVDGENALGHVQNLILVWDERIRDIDGCKDTLNRIIPVIHSLDNKRYAVIENCPDPPVPRITAAAAAARTNGSPTSSGKLIPHVDTTTAGDKGMRGTADGHHRRHQHDPIHNQNGS